MTVTIGRTQIHLGWQAFVGLMVFTIATTWEISGYKNSQDTKLDKIIAWQKEHGAKDSLYYLKTDQNTADIANLKSRSDSMRSDLKQMAFYTEKRINGQIILSK